MKKLRLDMGERDRKRDKNCSAAKHQDDARPRTPPAPKRGSKASGDEQRRDREKVRLGAREHAKLGDEGGADADLDEKHRQ